MSTPVISFPFTADRRVVLIGCGAVAQGLLPLLFVHFPGLTPANVFVLTKPDGAGLALARAVGVPDTNYRATALTPDNYTRLLGPNVLRLGDVCVNLSVDVSSVAVVELCSRRGALYVDTVTEPWAGPGGYYDATLAPTARTNYAQRETMVALRHRLGPEAPTAVTVHGANPGLVSHFFKSALLWLNASASPVSRAEWAMLARSLRVTTVHIAERDTQQCAGGHRAPNEFINTWSVEGFLAEALQPAELGWGTTEPAFPRDGHPCGPGAPCIHLDAPGAMTRVHSWTPVEGPYVGFLVTHDESISIADYYTVTEHGTAAYRPTVHYAYLPCDAAVQSLGALVDAGLNPAHFTTHTILTAENVNDEGEDALGVLVACEGRPGAIWVGSRLTNAQVVRALRSVGVTHVTNTATTLQVVAGVLGAMVWALENPVRGVVAPDDMDHDRVLEVARPYLGTFGVWETEWTPGNGAWSFANVRA